MRAAALRNGTTRWCITAACDVRHGRRGIHGVARSWSPPGSADQRLLDADPMRWLFTLFPAADAIAAREVRDEPSCLGLGESVPVDGARGGRMAAC
jgi:hypothetical protein